MNEQKAREVGVKIIDIMQNSDLKSSEAILVLANVFVSGWLAATNGHPDGRAGLLEMLGDMYDEVAEVATAHGIVGNATVQ